MNADVLTTKVADGIAVITLGSPKRIYFDAEMGDVLTEALDQFAGDAKVRVVVITGGAPGSFANYRAVIECDELHQACPAQNWFHRSLQFSHRFRSVGRLPKLSHVRMTYGLANGGKYLLEWL